MDKKLIFSGMQPSGVPHIGNYFGAIKNWAALQDDYNCLYCIVDLHAITIRQDPETLRKNTLNALALYIACGLDPDKNTIYVQSHYNGHSQLSWLLSCFAYMGELGRMTQYKDKSATNQDNINLGLFAYPVLQAADILLFGSHLVPVGEDQKQHLELTRDIAIRFNNIYGDIFTIPEVFTPKTGAKIKRLSDPEKKMSKSDGEGHYIGILDQADVVMKKFKKAVTDSDTEIRYDPENKAGVSNLLEIYALACDISLEDSLAEFEGKQYGHLKTTVAQALIDNVTGPIQAKYNDLIKNPDHLQHIAKVNAEKAKNIGDPILANVKNAIGLL